MAEDKGQGGAAAAIEDEEPRSTPPSEGPPTSSWTPARTRPSTPCATPRRT